MNQALDVNGSRVVRRAPCTAALVFLTGVLAVFSFPGTSVAAPSLSVTKSVSSRASVRLRWLCRIAVVRRTRM